MHVLVRLRFWPHGSPRINCSHTATIVIQSVCDVSRVKKLDMKNLALLVDHVVAPHHLCGATTFISAHMLQVVKTWAMETDIVALVCHAICDFSLIAILCPTVLVVTKDKGCTTSPGLAISVSHAAAEHRVLYTMCIFRVSAPLLESANLRHYAFRQGRWQWRVVIAGRMHRLYVHTLGARSSIDLYKNPYSLQSLSSFPHPKGS